MSADNGYVVRKNSHNRYILQMYFASNDSYPTIDESEGVGFDTLEEAVLAYQDLEKQGIIEYGLSIDIARKSIL